MVKACHQLIVLSGLPVLQGLAVLFNIPYLREMEILMKTPPLTNEVAKREFLIAPILLELIDYTKAKIKADLEELLGILIAILGK